MSRLSKFKTNLQTLEILLVLGEQFTLITEDTQSLISFNLKYGDTSIILLDLVQRIDLFNSTLKEFEEELVNKSLDKRLYYIIIDWNLYLHVFDLLPLSLSSSHNNYSIKIIKLVQTLISNSSFLTSYFCKSKYLIESLLKLMLNVNNLEPAIKLLEEIAINSEVVIDLTYHVKSVRDIYNMYSGTKIGYISRIFSIFLYDVSPESFDPNVKKSISINDIQKNIFVLLSLPNLFKTLLNCLLSKFKDLKGIAELSYKESLLKLNINSVSQLSSSLNQNSNNNNNNLNNSIPNQSNIQVLEDPIEELDIQSQNNNNMILENEFGLLVGSNITSQNLNNNNSNSNNNLANNSINTNPLEQNNIFLMLNDLVNSISNSNSNINNSLNQNNNYSFRDLINSFNNDAEKAKESLIQISKEYKININDDEKFNKLKVSLYIIIIYN